MFGHSADWKAANPNGDGITQPSQIGQSQRDCITKPSNRVDFVNVVMVFLTSWLLQLLFPRGEL